jgi:Spy/CpxP family protein refolding chaperone
MLRSATVIAAALVFAIAVAASARAQSHGNDAPPAHKAESVKGRWSNMLTKWRHNRPKLKACRAEARRKGLAGDDRWFFLENCMDKS